MLLIRHRVNTVAALREVPASEGIEIDVREIDGEICLAHDPFTGGERLEPLLEACRHPLVIFNVKCDGLEERLIELADQHGVVDYFLLDVANPTLVRLARQGVRRMAVRFSEYEPLESALRLSGLVDWVWIDCFTDLPLDSASWARLEEHFKLCLVSPELQGHPRDVIQEYKARLESMPVAAVCTDHPEDWRADD